MFETDGELKSVAENYKIIFDGRSVAPLISTPKIYRRREYFYILAAAGGDSSGWQIALRSDKIYGDWETKVIIMQGDSAVNGPCGGALADLDDEGEKWAFVHPRFSGAYGNVLHLEPAIWRDEWVLCGNPNEYGIAGTPVEYGNFPLPEEAGRKTDPSDEFENGLSNVWHTPANPRDEWFSIKRGLRLNCVYYGGNSLSDLPQLFLQKVRYRNFSVTAKCKLDLRVDGDEAGFAVYGNSYAYICVVRRNERNFIEIRKGAIGGGEDETIARSQPYDDNYITFKMSAKFEKPNLLTYKFTLGKVAFTHKFLADRGPCSGAKIGIYARSQDESKGGATFKFFRVTCTDNRVSGE